MNKIAQPLKPEMTGPAVADLQDALVLLAEKLAQWRPDPAMAAELEQLRKERREPVYGRATASLVGRFQKMAGVAAVTMGEVDTATAAALNAALAQLGVLDAPRVVSGRIRFAGGLPAARVRVVATDRDLRSEETLGEVQTDPDGAYRIAYAGTAYRQRERGTADLVVTAFDDARAALVRSAIHFNAPESLEVDLVIPAERRLPPSLYERIGEAVAPLLGDVKLTDLEQDEEHQDIAFLAGETGFDERDLRRYVLAERMRKLDIDPEFWFVVLARLLPDGGSAISLQDALIAARRAIPDLDEGGARAALAHGFARGDIAPAWRKREDAWIKTFLALAGRLLLGEEGAPSFAKRALDAAGIADKAAQAKFAVLMQRHRALTPAMLAELANEKAFGKDAIADLKTSYELAELTRGDFAIVTVIKEQLGTRRPEQIRHLAKVGETEWRELVLRAHKAGKIELPSDGAEPSGALSPPRAELLATNLARQFTEAFPTSAFAGGLEKALKSGRTAGIAHGQALSALIDAHPELELRRTAVDEFLKQPFKGELAKAAADPSFRIELKAVQRIFKLAPTFEATDALLAEKLHSGQAVYRIGESEFVRRFGKRAGFTPETARETWRRAADTHAAALTVIGDMASFESGILPGVLRSSHPDLSLFPNWSNLFGAGDICHCEHCNSALSPAAYFTDLLMYLRDRRSTKPRATGGFYSVRDILFDRRPDLGYLDLTCENALTTLPYVDVVCEVLESAVDAAGANDVALTALTSIAAGPAGKAAVKAALDTAGVAYGDDFVLTQVTPAADRWIVRSATATYLLKKKSTTHFFAQVLPNTKATREELRAYPAYVNDRVYTTTLRSATYPFALPQDQFPEGDSRRLEQRERAFSLPFDLFGEEVRAGLRKCNLQRSDLMGVLKRNTTPNAPTDGEIAAEYFGISVNASATTDEKRLILDARATLPQQQELWGEAGNAIWLSTAAGDVQSVANVKTFLRKTGLEYEELSALIDLPFITAAGVITVQHLDASCDTHKKVLQGLNAANLDRIHRFLRLWRKLGGWQQWELDLAIRTTAIGNGALNEPFLIALHAVAQLKVCLGARTTVEQVCALFGKLNTETRFTKSHAARADGLYLSLFLNKKLIQPLDAAFAVTAVDVAGPTAEKISGHRAAVLAALGIRAGDLDVLTSLTRATSGQRYITDDLTLANLSFLWRHAWLAKQLGFKADDWTVVLKLLQQDVASFASPQAALTFVENVQHLRNVGLSADQLNWILAADRTAKAAVKETDASRFLSTLRRDLQAVRAEYDPAQYEFLQLPSDIESLEGLLARLLQQLHRSEAEARSFIDIVRDDIVQEVDGVNLPAGFRFPGVIVDKPTQQVANLGIPIRYEPVLRFSGTMTAAQKAVLLGDSSLAAVTGLPVYQQAIERLFTAPQSSVAVAGLPQTFTMPAAITGAPHNIPIRFGVLRFTGLMTSSHKTALRTHTSLASVIANPRYLGAIEELFDTPRLALRFLDPVFTAPLSTLPATFDLDLLPDTGLKQRISFDAEQRVLRVVGILSADDKARLEALSSDAAFRAAVTALYEAPRATTVSPDKIWLQDGDLAFPLRDPSRPPGEPGSENVANLAQNLAKAIRKGLFHLANARVEDLIVQQAAQQLGLTAALTRRLLTAYPLPALRIESPLTATQRTVLLTDTAIPTAVRSLPSYQLAIAHLAGGSREAFVNGMPATFTAFPATITGAPNTIAIRYEAVTLLRHLAATFAETAGAVDYATLAPTFDAWFWAARVAALWSKWKITLAEWERLHSLTANAQIMDFGALPLLATAQRADISRVLRTSRLLALRGSLPQQGTTLLEVLVGLNTATPATVPGFAASVALMNDRWATADVSALVGALGLAFPGAYLLAETWERMQRAFGFVDSLGTDIATLLTFAAPTMDATQARTLRSMLRAKLGAETWLTLSAEIQDGLRQRKRDALAAYLLTHPRPATTAAMPADAPTRPKWENTNDLYAYYLLDVEMCACQLTSRLVQGSGSIQLFVQRCFMGLEPDVRVQADGPDGDTAWRWWKQMRKYRPWEANWKVWLWPENFLLPELRRDRSPFFKDLEKELLQSEINHDNVEAAFTAYLEKLDGVAQLEIAGFFQEDDGEDTILHVFGRTSRAKPHIYHYRRFDYRQWTPWEKVDVDIQSDYLIPAVVNKRLFLFWPEFTEIPDEDGNSRVSTPGANQPGVNVQKAKKRLRIQMAVSDYRQGKWTPKRVSTSFDESSTYDVAIVRKNYEFYFIDRTSFDGRFGIKYQGTSVASTSEGGVWREFPTAFMSGAFEMSACSRAPERSDLPGFYRLATRPESDATGRTTSFNKWAELPQRLDAPQNDLTIQTIPSPTDRGQPVKPLLDNTPWLFQIAPAWHLSYLDRLVADGIYSLAGSNDIQTPVGTWLPFFYADKKRTFFTLPCLPAGVGRPGDASANARAYYPDIKRQALTWDGHYRGLILAWAAEFDLAGLTPDKRSQLEAFLAARVPSESTPPFSDVEVRALIVRFCMFIVHYQIGASAWNLFKFSQYHFRNFYHPFVCDFAKLVYEPTQGIPSLMRRETQLQATDFSFEASYRPTSWVVDPQSKDHYPSEIVDFSAAGAYSSYNWELFFHAPLLIANALSRNHRFEEAREWYHFIFNPIGVESAAPGGTTTSKYWITKPFFETTAGDYHKQRIENIMRMLAGDTSVPEYSVDARDALKEQVRDWRNHPFDPHRIANYRTVAYQKSVVMSYLDNQIAWGDDLFRQDSMESINEATQLYIMAAEILGARPKRMPPAAKPPVASFNELEDQLDAVPNALVEIENLIPAPSGSGAGAADAPMLPTLYFCIPHNEKMLGYWDTIADRLYKIRHCMNIEGVVRQLALFEPPIDPMLLVKAAAAGVDIASAVADLNAPLPHYRFNVLLQKANEVCNDLKSMGSALTAALEKRDAESLSLLRQSQEIRILEAVRSVREQQIAEAKETLAALRIGKELATLKKVYYESRPYTNAGEQLSLDLSRASATIETAIAIGYVLSGGLRSVPEFLIGASGFGGSPHATAETGGKTFGSIAEDAALTLTSISRALDKGASLAATVGSHDRRRDDWVFQAELAGREISQIERSIAAAEVRVAVAEKELENHLLQIENAEAVQGLMQDKYTNEELYQWQIGQTSSVFFQSYKLAYDLAKRAERCFRFELGLTDSSFITSGYWDSLRKGLLSGEKLQLDLRRLEAAYLEQNRREFELTKHVSLRLLDPVALVKLRETGRCFFRLPEELFDLDFPGHYFRRIKSVSLTLPCVAGPYATVACTLRLVRNSIRTTTASGVDGYPRNRDESGLPAEDTRFTESIVPVRAIASSTAQNDSGVFDLSFRDERFLPFEGAGAISEWVLELFTDLPANNPDPGKPDFGSPLRQFDYTTIADAVLHLKYTAREDAGAFKNGAIAHLRSYLGASDAPAASRLALFDFGPAWQRFIRPENPAEGNVLELQMSPALFSHMDSGKTLKITSVVVLARCTNDNNYSGKLFWSPAAGDQIPFALAKSSEYGGMHFHKIDLTASQVTVGPSPDPTPWRLKIEAPVGGNLTESDAVKDLVLALEYRWE